MPQGKNSKGARTRKEILWRAVDLASVEGLGGLTLGRLAEALPMSKSGLFAHFGSKEELDLAVIEAAATDFEETALAPVATPGLARLARIAEAWLAYLSSGRLRGGSFFAAVAPEVDDKPGRLRDLVAGIASRWRSLLEEEARFAVDADEIRADSDPAQIAFELHAFVQEANHVFQLHGDADAFERARTAIGRILRAAATARGRSVLDRLDA